MTESAEFTVPAGQRQLVIDDCLRFTHIQLWSSRDVRNWERVANRQASIPWSPGGSDACDLNKNMPPSCPLVRGEELWFYYSGRKDVEASLRL